MKRQQKHKKIFTGSTNKNEVQKYIILQNAPITLDGLYDSLSQPLGLLGPLLNFRYLTDYSRVGKNTHARIQLGLGRVRVPPVGKKSCLCPSPSGQAPDTRT
jgi:hypothetical protein